MEFSMQICEERNSVACKRARFVFRRTISKIENFKREDVRKCDDGKKKKRYDVHANKFYDQERVQIWIFTNENYSCLGKQTCQTLFVRVPTFLSLVVKSIKRGRILFFFFFFFRLQNSSTREKIRAKDIILIQRKVKNIKYGRISFFFDYKIRLRVNKFKREM